MFQKQSANGNVIWLIVQLACDTHLGPAIAFLAVSMQTAQLLACLQDHGLVNIQLGSHARNASRRNGVQNAIVFLRQLGCQQQEAIFANLVIGDNSRDAKVRIDTHGGTKTDLSQALDPPGGWPTTY